NVFSGSGPADFGPLAPAGISASIQGSGSSGVVMNGPGAQTFAASAPLQSAGGTTIADLAQPVTSTMAGGVVAAGQASSAAGFAEPNLSARPVPDGPGPAASSFGGYSPAQIKGAYGVDKLSATGSGVTIAIVDAFDAPNIVSDLNAF